MWDQLLAAVVPAVAGHNATLSWALANEPGFFKANSSYTRAAFSEHLNRTYAGNLTQISVDWGIDPTIDPLTSFAEDRVHRAMGYEAFSAPQQLAWGLFNQQRVSAWFEWLCGRIQHHYGSNRTHGGGGGGGGSGPAARCHLKTSNGVSPFGSGHGNGIDRVALARSMPIAACDTRAELLGGRGTMANPTEPVRSHMPFAQLNATTYSMDWWSIAASYDFMRTVSPPGTPVWDTEWHPFSTVQYRDPSLPRSYVDAVGMLGALHGLSGTVAWYWGRSGWSGQPTLSKEFGGADFYASMTAQPIVMDAYSGFGISANALAVEIAAMVDAAPTIGLLYSEASALVDPAHRDQQLATYTLAHFLHGSIQFVPSDILALAPVPPVGRAIRGIAGLGVLFVAGVSHIADAELAGLRQLVEASQIHGAKTPSVVFAGNASSRARLFLYDQLGRERDPPPATLPWVRGVLFIDLGGEGGAAVPAAFDAMHASLAGSTGADAAAVRCVQPTEVSAAAATRVHLGGGRRRSVTTGQGTALPVFGVFCRSAVVRGRATVALVNLLNVSAAVDFRCGPSTRCGDGHAGHGVDLWQGANVSVPLNAGIVLEPMAVKMIQF